MELMEALSKIWPMVWGVGFILISTGGLIVTVSMHGRAITKLFDKMDANQDALTERIDGLYKK